MPTPEAERLFLESFTSTRERYRQSLDALGTGHLHLPNTDFDTERPTARGEYSLADDKYDELLGKLAAGGFLDIPESLRMDFGAYYGDLDSLPLCTDADLKRQSRIR